MKIIKNILTFFVIIISSFYLSTCKSESMFDAKFETSSEQSYVDDSGVAETLGSTPAFSFVVMESLSPGSHRHVIDIKGRKHRSGYKTPYKWVLNTVCGPMGTVNGACFCCHTSNAGGTDNGTRSDDLTGAPPTKAALGSVCGKCHAGGFTYFVSAPSCYTCHNRRWSDECKGATATDCPAGCTPCL